MRSAPAAVHWRARPTVLSSYTFRALHSQRVIFGRTSQGPSQLPRASVQSERQVSAILLSSVNKPLYAHTDTDRNPADAAFRSTESLAETLRWSKRVTDQPLADPFAQQRLQDTVVCEAPSGNCEFKPRTRQRCFEAVIVSCHVVARHGPVFLHGQRDP